MSVMQSIQNPLGMNVFGSALIRVEPDIVSLNFAVSRLRDHPKEAFSAVREGVQSIRAFLVQAGLHDVGSSRVTLSEEFKYTNNENRFAGYRARVEFHILLRELDRVEEILAGLVDAGANSIGSVDFQTSRLKELRAETRRRAVDAAREKGENYCKAAGVTLGRVLHIEDVNPGVLRGYEGHAVRETPPDGEDTLHAFNPGSITVSAAVMIAFEIVR